MPKLPDQQLKLVTIVRKDGNYYAMIAYDEPEKHLMQTGLNDGVDVNVGHLLIYFILIFRSLSFIICYRIE